MFRPVPLLSVLLLFAFAAGHAQSQRQQQKPQTPPATQPQPKTPSRTKAVTGKTGSHGKAINTSTTAATGIETPPFQTDNGMVQQPAQHPEIRPFNLNWRPSLGAPPNWEQVGQQEEVANANAAAASRAEIGGPEGTLGVGGALPSYAKGGKPTESSQTGIDQSQPGQTQRNSRTTGNTVRKPALPQ